MIVHLTVNPDRVRHLESNLTLRRKFYENGFAVCEIEINNGMDAMKLFHAGIDAGIDTVYTWKQKQSLA